MTRIPTEALARDLHEGADDIGRAVRRTGRRVAADASEAAKGVGAQVEGLGGRALSALRAKPRQTLALGAAAGVVLAFLLRRRRRR
jgi:ElaB/YqjD/DUF883 family membrane-anchored ribosome-binding protein